MNILEIYGLPVTYERIKNTILLTQLLPHASLPETLILFRNRDTKQPAFEL